MRKRRKQYTDAKRIAWNEVAPRHAAHRLRHQPQLADRVPRTAGTFPLYPQQRLLIGMLLHGCVDTKLKVYTRDLTRSLGPCRVRWSVAHDGQVFTR